MDYFYLQLQVVVAEQKFLRDQEATAATLEDRFAELETRLKALGKHLKAAAAQAAQPVEIVLPLHALDVAPTELRSTLLQEIGMAKVDSEKRLQAIEASVRLRNIEKRARAVDAFAGELKAFVDDEKLRKRGGAAAADADVERRRAVSMTASS